MEDDIERQEGETHVMSSADHRFINALAEEAAQRTTARIIEAAQDRETAQKVVGVWSDEIDRTIGRAVRRAIMWVAGTIATIAALKLGAAEKLVSWLK